LGIWYIWGERKVACKVFMGKPEIKRPLEKRRRRWGIILERTTKEWEGGMN
jgi:hypothetical protein